MKKYINKQSLVGIIVIIVFATLALIIGCRHEPWADEAQSWLIARDSSFKEILNERAKYEGTPCLWHFILKIFIILGLPYGKLYLVPILFSSIGVFLLVFKSNISIYIKVMLPFTYYIFYQYTIVARSYCLIFPVLCLISICYEKRITKPNLFCITILLLSSISLHTLILSGFLFIIYICDFFEWCKNNKNKKIIQNNLIYSLIICIFFLFTVIYVFPPSDVSFVVKGNFSILKILARGIIIVSNALISNGPGVVSYLLGFGIFITIGLLLYNKDKTLLPFYVIILPIVFFLASSYCNEWHIGIVFLSIVFAVWIYNTEDNILNNNRKKIVCYVIISCVFIVQITWTGCSIAYDYNNNYSAAYDTAAFIKVNQYEEKIIYGLGYSVTAIEPYFDENIFNNYNSDKSYYWWSTNNNYMTNIEIIENIPDIVIVADLYKSNYNNVINSLENRGYSSCYFKGNTFIKTNVYESESFTVYILK